MIPQFDPVHIPLPFTIPILNQNIISMFGILVASGLLFGAKVAMKKAANDGLIQRFSTVSSLGSWLASLLVVTWATSFTSRSC